MMKRIILILIAVFSIFTSFAADPPGPVAIQNMGPLSKAAYKTALDILTKAEAATKYVDKDSVVNSSWYTNAEVEARLRSVVDSLLSGTYVKGDSTYKLTYVATSIPTLTTLDDGIVSLWNLDEATAGPVIDSYGTNHGTNTGATVNQVGKVGTAYDFELSESDKITVADADNLSFVNSAFSISSWVKPESLSSYNTIVTKPFEYLFYIDVNGRVYLKVQSSTGVYGTYTGRITGVGSIAVGNWYNVVATYDGSNARAGIAIYINGIRADMDNDGQETVVGTTNTTGALTISYEAPNGGNYFDGIIDQVGIWNRVLTTGEVTELYNSGNGKSF